MKKVVSTVYVANVPAGLTVRAALTLIDVHVLCTVTPDIVVPNKLPSMGTFYPEYNIKLHFTPTCKLGWVPYPKIIFPIDITVAFNGVPFTRTLTSSADLEYNYATDIKTLIANKTITHESLKVEVTYPKYIRYYLLTGRKTIDKETKTFNVETGLEPPTPECTVDTTKTCPDGSVITTHRCIAGKLIPTGNVCPTPTGLITCTPSMSSLTTPANIPFKMPDPADLTSPPTLDLSTFEIYASISVPCVPAGTPAKLFPMDLDLTIDDGISSITGLVTVAGAGIFTSNIVSMIKDLMLAKTRAELVSLSSVQLILKYPGKVEFADANAVGVSSETKSVEKWIPVSIPVPPTPGCTEDTTITCPDGTV
ncbi:hypothetical protein KAW18_18925, partial [candidate division WOR-3 bacterium]|nr:hypothetical protein [candidate division WOR-3 bacterium]